MKYRPEVDGLRAIAVLPVISYHAGFAGLPGGFVGVDVFFVISGYLITTILLNELADGRYSILRFYERRARRILPALFVVMLACLPVAWFWMLPEQFEEFGRSLIAVPLFSSNVLFWLESNYFAREADLKPLLHTWSLAVEEQYYLLFPPILAGLWAWGTRRAALAVALMAITSLGAFVFLAPRLPEAAFYLSPLRAWELLAGSLCAFAMRDRERVGHPLLSWMGLAMIVGGMLGYRYTFGFPGPFAMLPVAGTALVILFATATAGAGRLLSLRPLVGIGLISYSAYLWHQPLFAFARIRLGTPPPDWIMGGLAVLTLMLAWVTWRYVEAPFRARSTGARPIVVRRDVFAWSALTGTALAAIGVIGVATAGLPVRMDAGYPERARTVEENRAERQAAIGSGVCHFNKRGMNDRIDTFLRAWDCRPDDDSTLKPTTIAVYGDSHAGDKVMALAQAGYDVLQMTGAGCPLLPMDRAPDHHCDRMLERFEAEISRGGIRTVLLSNLFNSQESSPDGLRQLIDYWSGRDVDVLLFTQTPTFADVSDVYMMHGADGVRALREIEEHDFGFADSLATVDTRDVGIIDTTTLLCGTDNDCAPIADGPLLIDQRHLSVEGARRSGANLVELLGPEVMQPPGKAMASD